MVSRKIIKELGKCNLFYMRIISPLIKMLQFTLTIGPFLTPYHTAIISILLAYYVYELLNERQTV